MRRSMSQTSKKSAKAAKAAKAVKAAKSVKASKIRFTATLLRPRQTANGNASRGSAGSWSFLTLPKRASARLPSRGQVSVEGTIDGVNFRATLEPDGRGGHWLKVDRKLREALGKASGPGMKTEAHVAQQEAGRVVTLEITPVAPDKEPEPKVPADLREALAAAQQKAKEVWSDITPVARRDFIQWIESAKRQETRAKRIASACDMLAKGKRRPCCFDRSGMYGKSLSCPVAEDM